MIENFLKSTQYITNLINLQDTNITDSEYGIMKDIELQAISLSIPIVNKDVLKFMLFLNDFIGTKKVLEIGTATGFSGMYLAKNLSKRNGTLTTIEIDNKRYNIAKENFSKLKLTNVNMINDNAFNYLENCDETYDMIFIDAQKGEYDKFLNLSKKILSKCGIIFIDNVLFRSYIGTDIEVPKKYKNMTIKMEQFIKRINDEKGCILPFGDGVALIKKED